MEPFTEESIIKESTGPTKETAVNDFASSKTSVPFVVMAKPVGPICNLDCSYCYYLEKTELYPRRTAFKMSEEVLESYVRQFIEASPGPIVHFVWHGGEPTLAGKDFYRRVLELQNKYLPEGWQVINNLQTNGTLLDDEWCAFLAEAGFHVGLSIDGPLQLHDRYRVDKHGGPSYQRVVTALDRLISHGINPDVLCTLTDVTARHPLEIYRHFAERGVKWIQFLPVVAKARPGQARSDGLSRHSVSAEAYGEFLVTVFDYWVRHDVGKVSVQTFEECFKVWTGLGADLCIMSPTCGLAPALEHNGDLYSCDHYVRPDYLLGNILEDKSGHHLAQLMSSHAQQSFGNAKRDKLPNYCRQCPVLHVCNGGCPKDRFATTPDGEPGLNVLCQGYKRFYTHVAPYFERMAELWRLGRSPALIMEETARLDAAKFRHVGRNDPCPCGSGKKAKNCCLSSARS
ncbi:MAG: anaerobic sulfatase maturase [Actinobacteria bacterium]|jgi:uncharacterized protein|nr:anaerobic sulfatase maturase [Actinomycetota bacterium]MCL6094918.1 anaerobic sulfatase maturase [Actinomycetota bacterium]